MRTGLAFIVLVTALGLVLAAPVPSRLDADRKALHSTDPEARRTAVLRLGWLGRDAAPAVPDLARALRDPDNVVAHDAANALVRIGPPAAEALGKALSDESPAVRWRARNALAQMGLDAKDAVPALADRVKNSKSLQLRVNAALVLGRMGPAAKAALPTLRAAASDRAAELVWYRARPSSVCEAAIIATRAIDPTALKELAADALPTLRAMLLEDGDTEEMLAGRQAAVRALALLGSHAAPALTDLQTARLVGRVEPGAFARACVAMGKDGQKHLLALISDPTEDENFRQALLGSLSGHSVLGTDAIRILVKLLADGDKKLRCLAALALAEQGAAAEPAIPALVKALADPTFDYLPDRVSAGYYASEALARIGPKAVPALRAALKDKTTRDRAVIALGRMESAARAAAPDLRELLAGQPTSTSVRAAKGLLRMDDDPKEPMRVLIAALDTDFRHEALEYLAHRDQNVFWPLEVNPRPTGPAVPRDAIPALLKLLEHESCRHLAATVLENMTHATDAIVPEIGKRLRTRAENRSALLGICAAFGPAAKGAIPDILWCLREDKSEYTQQGAIRALGAIGPAAKEALPILTSAAADPKHCARREAIWALGQLGLESPEVTDTLVAIMRDPKDGRPGRGDRRSSAAGALMQLGPAAKRAIPALREAQLSDDAIVRVYAIAALLRAGDDETPIERLLGAWRDVYDPDEMYLVLLHWLEAIELLGPRAAKAVPQLIALLADPPDDYEESYQSNAARALGKIGPDAKAALPRLRELATGRGSIARAATEAIRAIESK